ncbi:mitochondrial antiviral-signaling protein isoform X2 [Dasypus novemcinctus]|uniref:mitochondrial antiviral-signaling protein isoform X2 n=1 Tax=Dasypus novemcinctus TaxID=9361 RepID=UPI00265F0C6F|nr:mitochondrial antiviral-signaling protein [Dasypus novemcinctus]XP_058143476.1 mitochondrial antiviral-signaling protein [Dasypus novemcinctus]XP_058143477.1 mitochondrial antiviral-signaling protein [Dasypus novemcinctus]
MTFAEDETYRYIRHHFSNFRSVDVLEILPYLPCLTASDQDRLRASYTSQGNRDTLFILFNYLQRRPGWVDALVRALRHCELYGLADEVACVYQSNLPPPREPPPAPAAPYNGCEEEEPSYPLPVQDTRPPDPLAESSGQAVRARSPGAALPSRHTPPSDVAALSPVTSSCHQERHADPGSAPAAGAASSLPSPRGPVSPSVSFQPLARSSPRASRLPGPPGSTLSTGPPPSVPAGSAAAAGAGGQAEAAVCASGTGPRASSVPSSAGPCRLPSSPKSPGAQPSPVAAGPAPSRLPTHSTHIGAVPPRAPPGAGSEYGAPAGGSSSRQEEAPGTPARAGAAGSWGICSSGSGPQLSKPGALLSCADQPWSGCSEDLAISRSDPLDAGPSNAPEENEFESEFGIHVSESPSADLLAGNPGPGAAPPPPEEELPCAATLVPRAWLVAAAAAALLATVLTALYRRRLLR